MEEQTKKSVFPIITIPDILSVLRKRIVPILCIGIITGLIGFSYYSYRVTPIYSASTTMLVDVRKTAENDNPNQQVTSAQLALASRMVQSICVMLKNNAVLEPIIAELSLSESAGSLAGKMTVTPIDDTQMLTIVLNHPDPNEALRIINGLIDLAPDIINDLLSSGYIVPVGHPTVSSGPVYPNVRNSTIQFTLAGLILSAGVFIAIQMFDNKFKSISDVQSLLDLPVLGVIPLTDAANRSSKKKGARKS